MSRSRHNLHDPAKTTALAIRALNALTPIPSKPDPYQQKLQKFTTGVLIEAMQDHRCFGPDETARILLSKPRHAP